MGESHRADTSRRALRDLVAQRAPHLRYVSRVETALRAFAASACDFLALIAAHPIATELTAHAYS
jgi:predicted transcriptional regulator